MLQFLATLLWLSTKAYVNHVIKKPDGVVNRTFVQMMEAFGYDIKLTYVKRGKV